MPQRGRGEYSAQSENRRYEVLPPALRATPLSEGGACGSFLHSAVIQQGPPPKTKMRIAVFVQCALNRRGPLLYNAATPAHPAPTPSPP